MNADTTTTTQKVTIRLAHAKDCQGCVKFDAVTDGKGIPAMKNAYVSRIVPWINSAQKIKITIEAEA